LRVTDDDAGVSPLDTIQVTVENLSPTADSGGPYLGAVDTPLTLTGSGGDVSADTLTYAWDLNDDATFDQFGQIVTYTWTVSGTYPVLLQVSDEDGGVATSTTTVQVNSLVPVAWLTVYLLLSRRRLTYTKRKRRNGGGRDNLHGQKEM
jgi:PKD repeat protein